MQEGLKSVKHNTLKGKKKQLLRAKSDKFESLVVKYVNRKVLLLTVTEVS